jgi:acetyl-CoA acetyltransferase
VLLRPRVLPTEQIAAVAVKNHGNAAHNRYAQFQRERTLEEVMQHPVAGPLTRLQCCAFGEEMDSVNPSANAALRQLFDSS